MLERMSESRDGVSVAPCEQRVDPPVPVWIDARRVFPRDPHATYANTPAGVQVSYEVRGLLFARVARSDGGWLGKVRFQLLSADGQWSYGPLTQLVPAHLLRPHRWGRRGERGGLSH
jgi:hypothetical protein